MRITGPHGDVHLTYCLNIHPGETWRDNLAAIRNKACAVRDRLGIAGPFGLGLRLSAQAAEELAAPPVLDAFARFMDDQGLYAFTINGFPFTTFHGTRVKENVYAPDWTCPERVEYTLRLGRILARLLPDGVDGSISTVPGTYRAWAETTTVDVILRNLVDVAANFAELESRTGRRVSLALEPEPDCLWDSAEHMVALFGSPLLRRDAELCAAPTGASRMSPDELIRRHLGVCLDTCHQSVLFETPVAALALLQQHGVPVAKIQVSAAPAFPCSRPGLDHAKAFIDSCYLHQSCIRGEDGMRHRFPDLPEAIAGAEAFSDACELRTHFHIPLVLEDAGAFLSTRRELNDSFWQQAVTGGVSHIEVETYTFDVLPADLKSESLEESIAGEIAWTRERLSGAVDDLRTGTPVTREG